MKNPLRKRYLRELRQDIGKYAVIFLFLILTIGFVSGFLVADGSMKTAYDESFEEYNIEDGHFSLREKADASLLEDLTDQDISVYELFYKDKEGENEHIFRIFNPREKVNLVSLMEGELPREEDEVAIDRLYGENNSISLGDSLSIDNKTYIVSGFLALSDYSALFKNNTDMMFDAQKFTVAIVTEDAFEALGEGGLKYCYAWRYNDKSLTDNKKQDKADKMLSLLAKTGAVTDFVTREENQAIMFTGDDMGSDKAMITCILYIVIVILAFVFAVTIINTIEQEARVIGTLRASGYTKGELLRHYLTLLIIVSVIAAIIGNILGYTLFKWLVVKMYYGSYSLPTYETIWNAEAFIMTTLVPWIIMLAVNFLVLWKKLSLSPLKFIRNDLSKGQKKKAVKLPEFKFLSRFRIRVILQNMSAYFIMFLGILLANIILFFGLFLSPLLDKYKEDVVDNQIAEYQYILKVPVETENDKGEKYAVKSLQTADKDEEITVYGIDKDSRYMKELSLPKKEGEVVVSDGYMEKYNLKVGDNVTIYEKYGDEEYTLTVTGSYHYPAALSVFLSREQFCEVFNEEEGYFSGYFSDEKLKDIDETYIATIITQHDLTIITDQLSDSFGSILPLFAGFAIAIYMLMIYLLSKIILDKNASSISMLKILGYNNREISRLYIISTAVVVILSLIISLPLCSIVMKLLYRFIMESLTGWLTFYIAPEIFVIIPVIGIVSYTLISLLHFRKIKSIPMEEVLKNAE